MKTWFKKIALVFAIIALIAIPLAFHWTSKLTEAEVAEWKMWINLAKNGYAEPMEMEKATPAWWKFWEKEETTPAK